MIKVVAIVGLYKHPYTNVHDRAALGDDGRFYAVHKSIKLEIGTVLLSPRDCWYLSRSKDKFGYDTKLSKYLYELED